MSLYREEDFQFEIEILDASKLVTLKEISVMTPVETEK